MAAFSAGVVFALFNGAFYKASRAGRAARVPSCPLSLGQIRALVRLGRAVAAMHACQVLGLRARQAWAVSALRLS